MNIYISDTDRSVVLSGITEKQWRALRVWFADDLEVEGARQGRGVMLALPLCGEKNTSLSFIK